MVVGVVVIFVKSASGGEVEQEEDGENERSSTAISPEYPDPIVALSTT